MRYVIYGAGAIGATIGARLHEHGHEVVLVARGAHLEALQRHGLRFFRPEGEVTHRIPAVASPADISWRDGDVVVAAMKSQHTLDALDRLASVAPASTPIVSAQNGVENERMALRRFENVYAMCVIMPSSFFDPGVVYSYGIPTSGVLDVGRYPSGVDDCVKQIAEDLNSSGFSALAQPDIMARKYRKLMQNLGNAIDAMCGAEHKNGELYVMACDEAMAVFSAAGIELVDAEDDRRRRQEMKRTVVGGQKKPGSSSYQSLAKGADSTEVDYLNGEIVLLGRLHGVATPVNALLQREAARATRERIAPGSIPVEDLKAQLI